MMRYRSSLNCCCGLMIFSRIMALDRNLISVPCTIYAPGNTLSVDLVFSLSVHYSVCPLLCLSVCAKTNCYLGHNFRIILVTSSIFSSTGQRPDELLGWVVVRSPSVRLSVRPSVRPSVSNFVVYTLATININQS